MHEQGDGSGLWRGALRSIQSLPSEVLPYYSTARGYLAELQQHGHAVGAYLAVGGWHLVLDGRRVRVADYLQAFRADPDGVQRTLDRIPACTCGQCAPWQRPPLWPSSVVDSGANACSDGGQGAEDVYALPLDDDAADPAALGLVPLTDVASVATSSGTAPQAGQERVWYRVLLRVVQIQQPLAGTGSAAHEVVLRYEAEVPSLSELRRRAAVAATAAGWRILHIEAISADRAAPFDATLPLLTDADTDAAEAHDTDQG